MPWHVAHVIMSVRFRDGNQDRYPVWENLILIEATSEKEAWEKAEQRAREDEGDSGGSFVWDDRPASWVFEGVRKLNKCDIPLERPGNGTELSYSELEAPTKEALRKLVAGDPVELRYVE